MKLRNKKTGENGDYKVTSAGYLIGVHDSTSGKSWQYDCLEGFNEDWEDYKPTEPLIKDEKVKKLLGEVVELELTVNELSKRFDEFNKHYVELCGEEEE